MVKNLGTRRNNAELESFSLDATELDRRASETYASFYLMLVGIIQGLATGYLVLKGIDSEALKSLTNGLAIGIPSPDDISLSFRFLISFTAIIIVTHEYTLAVTIFRRGPNYLDIFATLSLGITEVLSIHFVYQMEIWWLFNGVFLASAILAYFLTWQARGLNLKPKTRAVRRNSRYLISTQILSFAAAIVCFNAFSQEINFGLKFEDELLHYAAYLFFGLMIMLGGAGYLGALRRDLLYDAEGGT